MLATVFFFAAGCNRDAKPFTRSRLQPPGAPAPTRAATVDSPRVLIGPQLALGPNPAAPLSAIVRLKTDVPTTVELAIDDGEKTTRVVADANLATEHAAQALGLPADHAITIAVTIVDESGRRVTIKEPMHVRTPPLPPGFPPVKVTVRKPGKMEPGVTFFNVRGSGPAFVPPTDAYLIMVDDLGRVVWYFESKKDIVAANRMRNGHLLYLSGRKTAVEIDMLGNVVHTWFAAKLTTKDMPDGAIPLDLDTVHHEILELPPNFGADFLALSTEMRAIDDWPADANFQPMTRRTANVVGDVVAEFNRDGTIVRRIPLLDLLDPKRVCYDSLDPFWSRTYGTDVDPKNELVNEDWAHANAVSIDPQDQNYIISCRNQDVVFKYDRAESKVRWLLGPPMNWRAPWSDLLLRPKSKPFEWNYHQHEPRSMSNGDLLVFDNGDGRATPPMLELCDALRYSRAVQYRIDEKAMTVEQVWAYGGSATPWYSWILGGVAEMHATGNVLVTDGGKQISPTVRQGFARVFEVTRAKDPELVFELVVRDDSPIDAMSWNVYRSERFASVYPTK